MTADQRHRAVVDAAEDVFLRNGYVATSMSDIAGAAGMSRKTLYSIYGSKEGLLSAVIAERTRAAVPELSELTRREPLDEVLYELLHRITTYVLAPRQIAMVRLVISEAGRSPTLAAKFYWEGVHRGSATLAELLETAAAEGLVEVRDPVATARTLAHMAFGDLQLSMLLGAHEPRREDIDERVAMCVAIFLNGARRARPSE